MEATCIRQTDLPHTSKLFADFVYHPDRVSRFYSFDPGNAESYAMSASQIDYDPKRREAMVAALRRFNGPSASLDLLARPGTVAVVTGQQVGLFSGPAYTIYKALTAVRLARQLSERGIPAVPVFWLATEDHDFAEVNQAWVFDAQHRPHRLVSQAEPDAGQPVGTVVPGRVPLDELESILGGRANGRALPFAEDALRLVREAYAPGQSFGQSFSSLLRALLAKHDIPHLDPMSPDIRELAAPILREALAAAPELKNDLLERNKELAAAGYHAQVHVEQETSLFFLLENGRRVTLRRQNGDYLSPSRRISVAELLDRAHELSPNALLRPVVQDYLLPTVAYVGGPAELAYLAQSQVLYRRLLGRQPVALHRSGFTVLDERSRKLMHRYALELPDFFHGQEHLKERIASRLVSPALSSIMDDTKTCTMQSLERLSSELAGFEPTLSKAVAKSRRKIEYQIHKIERKVAHEAFTRSEKAARDAESLYGLIYPHKHLQERLYSIVPLLAKHGLELIDRIYESVRLDCPDHQMLVI